MKPDYLTHDEIKAMADAMRSHALMNSKVCSLNLRVAKLEGDTPEGHKAVDRAADALREGNDAMGIAERLIDFAERYIC